MKLMQSVVVIMCIQALLHIYADAWLISAKPDTSKASTCGMAGDHTNGDANFVADTHGDVSTQNKGLDSRCAKQKACKNTKFTDNSLLAIAAVGPKPFHKTKMQLAEKAHHVDKAAEVAVVNSLQILRRSKKQICYNKAEIKMLEKRVEKTKCAVVASQKHVEKLHEQAKMLQNLRQTVISELKNAKLRAKAAAIQFDKTSKTFSSDQKQHRDLMCQLEAAEADYYVAQLAAQKAAAAAQAARQEAEIELSQE